VLLTKRRAQAYNVYGFNRNTIFLEVIWLV
jgi:hypothetical protein